MSGLLYIFWSWPRPDAGLPDYSNGLNAFRDSLEKRAGGELTAEAASFRSAPPPWLPQSASAFSDWWPMKNASALDSLNEGVQESSVKPSHDSVAALYGGGAGSLYDWKRGAPWDPERVKYTHWFAKPAGMSYGQLYEILETVLSASHATLLRRRMVLGPSPEFCIASEGLLEWKPPLDPLRLEMTRI